VRFGAARHRQEEYREHEPYTRRRPHPRGVTLGVCSAPSRALIFLCGAHPGRVYKIQVTVRMTW
jgi:hypothetical protein